MVDKPKVDQMLTNLRKYHDELREVSLTPREEFLGDKYRIGSTKYHFIIAIECCIDIANHIISSENYRFPKDNADSFVVLIERGILKAQMRDSLGAMARFRNRLVHLYWEVDDELVYDYLQDSISDIARFAQEMGKFLEGKK